MNLKLRLTEAQHTELRSLLFRGDGNEAVAVALCGRHRGSSVHVFTVQELHAIPDEDYLVREPNRLEWHTRSIVPLLDRARLNELGLLVVHSHPSGPAAFSAVDDEWDRKLFPSLHGWFDRIEPLASAVMTSDGRLTARAVMPDGKFHPAQSVMVVGDDIRIWGSGSDGQALPEFTRRHEQFFGESTTRLLRGLRVGVVGCSGTGTPVIEMHVRLGVGHLVLVDPGPIRDVNLNRSVGTTADEVGESKVASKKRYIGRLGLGGTVDVLEGSVNAPEAIAALAQCDVLFGCVDSFGGRSVINRIATHYIQPYIDMGVGLHPAQDGKLQTVQVATHYLKPGGSSLRSRGMYSSEDLTAEELLDIDPEEHRRRVDENYLIGVDEESPTVISINFLVASRAVNAMLARLHPGFHARASYLSARIVDDLRTLEVHAFEESPPCDYLRDMVGRADVTPLLGIPLCRGQGLQDSSR